MTETPSPQGQNPFQTMRTGDLVKNLVALLAARESIEQARRAARNHEDRRVTVGLSMRCGGMIQLLLHVLYTKEPSELANPVTGLISDTFALLNAQHEKPKG